MWGFVTRRTRYAVDTRSRVTLFGFAGGGVRAPPPRCSHWTESLDWSASVVSLGQVYLGANTASACRGTPSGRSGDPVKLVVPSLSNLAHFANARSRGLKTHVATDKRQSMAPKTDRFPSFFYEKFLSAVIEFVTNGLRGGALERVVEEVTESKRNSYIACGKGIKALLVQVHPTLAKRGKRRIEVVGPDGTPLVSVRVHLELTTTEAPATWCYLHFSEARMTEIELQLAETALALSARQLNHIGRLAVVAVRKGEIRYIQPAQALTEDRITSLANEAKSYKAEWAEA